MGKVVLTMFQVHRPKEVPAGQGLSPITFKVTSELNGKVVEVGTVAGAGGENYTSRFWEKETILVWLNPKLDITSQAYLQNSHHEYNPENNTICLYPDEFEEVPEDSPK